MLLLEQYLVIYLLSIIMVPDKDVKILCAFLSLDFIFDSVLYSYMGFSVKEYLITISIIEISLLLFFIQFVKDLWLRNIFILCFIPTLISPFFILTLDHWITRDDLISYLLFEFCKNVARYSNEVFLSYLLYKKKSNTMKGIYWQSYILCNYLYILILK